MGYGTRIDAATVAKAASDVHATSESSRQGMLLKDAEAAGTGHPGWKASTASTGCVKAWQERLRQEANDVEAAAKALASSANSYVTTDRAVADSLTEDATWLKGA
ncbi:hypothetical protein [Streptomyces sp. NRRL WC-3742]|uniref:hypothetical protein n=1 Tax=Streptomyces sp. NRRL WC-3742 TaxID=1463934 RepID=UPI0004C4EACA|nr:hypothetical protein [Streptomyces sp. NRRL WC-3742]